MASCIAYIVAYVGKGEKSSTDIIDQALQRAQAKPGSTDFDLLTAVHQALLSHRLVSLPEACWLTSGLALYFASESSVYIPVFVPEERRRMTKSLKALEAMPGDSEVRDMCMRALVI